MPVRITLKTWLGGNCPVSRKAIVTIKFRNGAITPFSPAETWDWQHYNCDFDIIGYQLH